jgi:hypothetical protein
VSVPITIGFLIPLTQFVTAANNRPYLVIYPLIDPLSEAAAGYAGTEDIYKRPEPELQNERLCCYS